MNTSSMLRTARRWLRRCTLAGASAALLVACTKPTGGTTPPGRNPGTDPQGSGGPSLLPTGRAYPEPPPPTAPKAVNFPDVASFTLANGLTTYVIENHEVPIVSAQLVVRAGSMDDPHLAEFTAQMLGEGTRSRPKAKLDEAIEFVGGSLDASATTHITTVSSLTLARDLKLAMLLMADQVLNPLFPAKALDKLKRTAKTSLRIQRSQPDALADILFGMVAFPDGHPYGQPIPTAGQIDGISLDDLKKFHATFFRANNAVLLLSGDIDIDTAKPLVQRAFGGWAKASPREIPPNPLNRFTRYELPDKLTVHLVDRKGSAQADIRVGNIAVARNSEDWPALSIANQILGGGPKARLFADVREERGLTYRIGSAVTSGQAPGTFVIKTNTRTPTTGAMLAALFEHIGRMRQGDPPLHEFEAAVRTLVGSFPLQVETPNQIVSKVKAQLIYDLPDGYWQTYRNNLAMVEVSDVHTAALRYMHALPVVVVVGDAAKIVPQIEQVLPDASIVQYDDRLQVQSKIK